MANKSAVSENKLQENQTRNAKEVQQKKQTKYVNPILGWGLILAAFVIAIIVGVIVIPPLA